MIRDTLLHIARNYEAARLEKYAGNSMAQYLRKEGPKHIWDTLAPTSLTSAGGAGQGGGLPKCPWIALFDPAVTDAASKGYYIVYLFSADMQRVYLSLNQGTWEIEGEFGKNKKALKELTHRADLMRSRVSKEIRPLKEFSIDLADNGPLRKGYVAGHAFGYQYAVEALPDEENLMGDLANMVRLYRTLILRGGEMPQPTEGEEDKGKSKEEMYELRQYRIHRRLEGRNPKLAKAAKKFHGCICQACEFVFSEFYGNLGNEYIEAHHLIPVATLKEGEQVPMDPERDFAVLCANCHRMVHKSKPPLSVSELKQLIAEQKP